jgi:hypothetical protein
MPIIAKASGSNFIPAPAGPHPSVCVDVVDLGTLEITYANQTKKQHKIDIVWQISEEMDDGRPYRVKKRYTLSLHEKAGLRKDLENWRGRPFTDTELDGFDVETVIGVACLLNVIHNASGGNIYANVSTIMRLPKGMQAPTARDYVRVIDREPPEGQPEAPWNPEITDDDVPFS